MQDGVVRGTSSGYLDPNNNYANRTHLGKVDTSLLQNFYYGTPPDGNNFPEIQNSVLLNLSQRWTNNYGDEIVKGTEWQLGNSLLDSRSVVVMVEQHEGASYALSFYSVCREAYRYSYRKHAFRSVVGR